MKIGEYKKGLGVLGQKMFDNLRVKHKLKGDRAMLLLRIVAESWEIIVNSKQIINSEGSSVPSLHGSRPHPETAISKDAKRQLMSALQQLELNDYSEDPFLARFR